MKRLIIILVMLLLPISYVGAEDKETVDPAKDKTLMPFKGYLSLPFKFKRYFYKERLTKENEMADFLDSIEEQRRIIGFGRMGVGGEITNLLNTFENEKIKTSPFSWMIMPDIKEGQPAWLIRFTYSF